MQVEFAVGAKAARLIGRENITDVDGALVELIKNAYDADATCVWVRFSMPFPSVPDRIELHVLASRLSEEDFVTVCGYYEEDKKKSVLVKRQDLSESEREELQRILFHYNEIVVLDNGSGMNGEIVRSSWMYIGTSTKETQVLSPIKKRVRTGAKGIGRFALDKLSVHSKMYTRERKSRETLCWEIDWDQFAFAKLINEVKASLEEIPDSYEEIVKRLAGAQFEQLSEYDWSSGTAIVLSPVREAWSERLFGKVNTNLRSINPIGSVDRFDVIIHNEYAPKYNYMTEKVAISPEDYDYRIKVRYDGEEDLEIKLLRNEVDVNKRSVNVTVKMPEASKTCELDEFWRREKFQKKNYRREDYRREITIHKNAPSLLKEDEAERVREIGPFSAELYFVRNTSNEHEIMKKVNSRKRKVLLDKFSGIKIYRDEFKVRPYGDEGAMEDWIGMGRRAQKSPASVAHQRGAWRVQPYQMIGFVRITREGNPMLADKANREGIAINNAYMIFVDLLRECLKEFEYDRQYIYREYAKWIEEQENSLRTPTEKVVAAAMARAEGKQSSGNGESVGEDEDSKEESASGDQEENPAGETGTGGFTEDDYLGAVYDMAQKQARELNSKQILQILSSSGIVLNTFFHEFSAINTQFHVRTNQMRSRIDYLLQGQEYVGLRAYDPYRYIENTIEKNDRLMAAFLDVIMEGLKKPNLVKQVLSLEKLTESILSQWSLLLEEKHISVEPREWGEECFFEIAVVDWYIILNNFMLNSAWFLEKTENPDRKVKIILKEERDGILLELENNGPPLAEKFRSNPDRIFELGETSKENEFSEDAEDGKQVTGTGLGLWLVKETVERCGGTICVKDTNEGFGLRITFRK